MKKVWILIFVLCLAGLLIRAMPAKAEDASGWGSGRVGSTAASGDDGGNKASATAAGPSLYNDPDPVISIGEADAGTGTDPGSNHDEYHSGKTQTENTAGFTITVDECETHAEATTHEDGSMEAEAIASVSNINIKTPEGAPVKMLVEGAYSEGRSWATVETEVGPKGEVVAIVSHMGSESQISGKGDLVYLYDRRIAFESAGIRVESEGRRDPNGLYQDIGGNYRVYVHALRALDPDTNTYTAPVDFDSSVDLANAESRIEADKRLESLNAILTKHHMRLRLWADELWPDYHETFAMKIELLDREGKLSRSRMTIAYTGSTLLSFWQASEGSCPLYFFHDVAWTPSTAQASQASATTKTQTFMEPLPNTGADLLPFAFVALGLIGTGTTLWRKYS